MMPQLGVLAAVDKKDLKDDAKKAALEVFHKDCLIRLGTCVTPVGKSKKGELLMTAEIKIQNENIRKIDIFKDDFIRIEAPYEPVDVILTPGKNINVGGGPGEKIDTQIYGGTVGLIFDGRERPIKIPSDSMDRLNALNKWSNAINEYPQNKD